MRKLLPTLITDRTIEHIHSRASRRHIRKQEIREVLSDPKKRIKSNKQSEKADLFVNGEAHNGKKLSVYVKLRSGDPYWSEVVTAWEVK